MRRIAGRGIGGRRSRGGGGGAAYPSPDWHLESEDALFSSNLLTSWPSRVGPTLVPESGYEPTNQGPTANGIAGVLMPTTTARAKYLGQVIAGTHSVWTWEVVMDPDNDVGYGDREYPIYFENNTATSTAHLVFGHQSNNGGVYTQIGQYSGGVWQVPAVTPRPRLHVRTYVQEADGTLSAYYNGAPVGTGGVTSPSHQMTYVYVGSNYGATPPPQGFKGTIYSIRMWAGRSLDATEVAAAAADRVTRFAVAEPSWLPGDAPGLTQLLDARGKLGPSSAYWRGAADLATWSDQSGGARHALQGTSASRPRDGARINGRPTVDFDGTDDFLACVASSNFIGAGAFTIHMLWNIDAVNTNNATVYSNDTLIGDASGFWGLFLKNNAGTYTLNPYIYDGATKTVAAPFSLGTHLVQFRHNGTTAEVRVDDGSAVTVAAGNITNLTTAMQIGRRISGTEVDGQLAESHVRNAYLSGTDLTNARAFFAAKYGVSV